MTLYSGNNLQSQLSPLVSISIDEHGTYYVQRVGGEPYEINPLFLADYVAELRRGSRQGVGDTP